MTLGNVRDLYQQVILEHYKKPRHKGKTDPVHRHQRGHNPSCGDTIELTVQLNEAGDTFPVRIKCANLTWHTLKAALESTATQDAAGFVSNENE
jgi:NifU-like protein involved in Fe-S cluster formation